MGRQRLTTVILILFLFLGPVFFGTVKAQPSQGNWVVTGTQLVQNELITLNGNLTIQSGGNLTLRSVNLTMNVQLNGQYGIAVQPGGSLYVYNSRIISSNPKNRFSFIVNGNNLVMKNSVLQGVGWCTPTDNGYSQVFTCLSSNLEPIAGPVIQTAHGIIENNLFSGNAVGLIAMGSYATIVGNRFKSNDLLSLRGDGSSYDLIMNNTFNQDPTIFNDAVVVFDGSQNSTFSANTMFVDTSLFKTNPLLRNGRMDGFLIDGGNGNTFMGNNVTVANIAITLKESHDGTITGNWLTFGEGGVFLTNAAVNSRVIGNTMNVCNTCFQYGAGASYGIYANLAHNSVVANNTISGRFGSTPLEFDHTSNSSILNNDVSVTRYGSFAELIFLTSNSNSVIANRFSGSIFGMVLSGASNHNLVTRNEVLADRSVTIQGSSSNLLFLNNFHDFAEPNGGPYDNGANAWFNGTNGNYWSHYTRSGINGTGVGDAPYTRKEIPPNGTEPISLTSPAPIVPATVPQLKPIPLPSTGSIQVVHSIKNQIFQFVSGTITGNLTITNSTLLLAKTGPVYIGSYGGSLTIVNSRLIDMGYGYSLGCRSDCPTGALLIKNSTLTGAYLNDLTEGNVTIESSTIASSPGDRALSVAVAKTFVVENNTFSGANTGIATDVFQSTSDKILISGNKMLNIIGYAIALPAASATHPVTVAGNLIVNSLQFGLSVDGNTTVSGNTIELEKSIPLFLQGDNNVVFGNSIVNSTYQGLVINGGGNMIHDNSFANVGYPMDMYGSGNLLYRNNFIASSSSGNMNAGNIWNYRGEGNYWSGYTGSDSDLDGIGDSPYINGNIVDNFPFMKPNGWLTKFYLTLNTSLPYSTQFSINGTAFKIGQSGTITLRLGYGAKYNISLPQSVALSNGTTLVFGKWGDGSNSPARLFSLSSNSTLQATYSPVTATRTTTTSTTTTSTTSTSSSTATATSTSSTSVTTASSANSNLTSSSTISRSPTQTTSTSSINKGGGGIPEFPYQSFTALFAFLLVVGYLIIRRRCPST